MGNTQADCQALLTRIYEFLDNEIEEGECAALEAHIDACPECFHHVEFERAVKDVVRRKCSETLPDGLLERLRGTLGNV